MYIDLDKFWWRWIYDAVLLFAVLVAVGVVVGLVGALAGDGPLTGVDSTIIHHDYNTGKVTSVETPNDDPSVGWLFLGPFLTLYWGTLITLPFVLFGLLVSEILSLARVPEKGIRAAWIAGTLLIGSLALWNSQAGAFAIGLAGMVVYACLVKLPRRRNSPVPATTD